MVLQKIDLVWRYTNIILLSFFFAYVLYASALNTSETNVETNSVVYETSSTTLKSTSKFSSTPEAGVQFVQGSDSRTLHSHSNGYIL